MSDVRYIHGKTAEEREPNFWDTIRGLEAKLVIAEYEAREKISARQDAREALLQSAIEIAENAIDVHGCNCSGCRESVQRLNNLKAALR